MSEQQVPGGELREAEDTLDLTIKGATVYGREDLITRLTTARHLLSSPSVMVYVVGEFKQGKSSLINALLTAEVCAVDDDIATAVPTIVQYSAEPAAAVTYVVGEGELRRTRDEPIPVAAAAAYATEAGAAARGPGGQNLQSVRIGVRREVLAGGLVLVDTPGVGGLGSVHSTVTVGALPQAHAVVFVSDASQELTAAEIKFLRTAQELCPTVIVALTKTDLYVEWRRILTINLGHLRNHGIDAIPIALSSELRLQAAATADQAMNGESGFPELVTRLREVVRDSERLTVRAVGNHVISVVDQLESTVRARQTALIHPERTEQLTADLVRARDGLEKLRARSARWQQLLFDGFADISSNIDHDLRTRSRSVLLDAEAAIEQGDPAKNSEEFGAWLRQRLAGETMDNYCQLVRDSKELAGRVATHFELEEAAIVVPFPVEAPVGTVESIEMDLSFAAASRRMPTAMAGVQGFYGGLMMFTLLTSMAGLGLPVAAGLGAAVFMARTGMVGDRGRQLEGRRSKAKMAVRRFIDEFNSHVGKDSRDALRRIQRELRDGYTERIDELLRSLSEALKEAEQALLSDQTEQQQLQRIEADLQSLAMLRDRADSLLRAPAAAGIGG
jgi:hypothetical protein